MTDPENAPADASADDALITANDGDAGESEGDSEDVAQNGNDLDGSDDDDDDAE